MMAPLARLAHALPGRKRIKIDEKRGDEPYFESVKKELSGCPGVLGVDANCLTASVLLHHAIDDPSIWHYAAERGLFHLAEDGSHALTATPQVTAKITSDQKARAGRLKTASSRHANLRALIFLSWIGVGIAQAIKGNIAIPALSAFWYALNILPRASGDRDVEAELLGIEPAGRL